MGSDEFFECKLNKQNKILSMKRYMQNKNEDKNKNKN